MGLTYLILPDSIVKVSIRVTAAFGKVVATVKRNALLWITLVLVLIGGLNWGLVGIFRFDLVAAVLGHMTALSRIVYTLVGLSAVVEIIAAFGRSGASRA